MTDSMYTSGTITDIERYAINDGFGLRTTVFLKGCPLRCRWCSNPETQNFYPEMVFFQNKCIGCGACTGLCGSHALKNGALADRSICEKCYLRENAFSCINECYPKCRKIAGDIMTVQQVIEIVKRDMSFYQLSGGGVTLSGGEPLAQPEFTIALLKALCDHWIDTAVETCGAGKPEDIESMVPFLKFAFIDLKCMDNAKHSKWTGQSNIQILSNIRLMDRLCEQYGFQLIIRTPIIPGFNNTVEEISRIAVFVSENCPHVTGMELLPFHRLGRGKYTSLGREYTQSDTITPPEEEMTALTNILVKHGIPVYQF